MEALLNDVVYRPVVLFATVPPVTTSVPASERFVPYLMVNVTDVPPRIADDIFEIVVATVV